MNSSEKGRISNMTLEDFNKYQMGILISSSVLCETIVLASDTWKPKKEVKKGIKVYTVSEVMVMLADKDITEEDITLIHQVKDAFNGQIIKKNESKK